MNSPPPSYQCVHYPPMDCVAATGLTVPLGFDGGKRGKIWWEWWRQLSCEKYRQNFTHQNWYLMLCLFVFRGWMPKLAAVIDRFVAAGIVVMLVFCGREERGMVRIVVSIKLWKISRDFDSPYCYYYANAWSWQHSKYPTRTTMRSAITETMMKQHHLIEGNEAIKMMAWKVMRYCVGAVILVTRCVQTI